VLADPFLAFVHRGRDAGDVGAAARVGQVRDLRRPWWRWLGDEATDALADPGVDHSGDVAGVGQAPLADGVSEDPGWVQVGQLGGAQGPPQPPFLRSQVVAVAGGQGGGEDVAVALVAVRGGLGDPDGVQDGEVVGVGQVLPHHLGG
jgi:hypothetical protein